MKKIFSTVILVLLLFNNLQIAQIYADSDANLELEKQKNIVLLDKVGDLTSTIIDKIDNKIIDEESSQRLREKEIEIEKYIEDTKKQIENESSKGDIKELTEDVANVVVLKVVSGVTKYQDIEDNLGTDIKKEDKKEALETIQESLSEGDYYNLIIKTILSKEEILNRYKRFDEKLKVDFLYNDDKNNYYEFFISNDSIFRREMLEDIESGNIPDTFLGVEIVKPEVFAVESLELKQSSSVPLVNKLIQLGTVKIPDNLTKVGVINTEIDYVDSLKGENLDLTWGVNKFNLFSQLSVIKSTNKKIKVGVVDTGIDYNHPDLKGKVSKGYDFVNNDDDALDDQGHGTHVAGTIGANINGAGIIGVNPYVEFVPLKICNSKGFCPSYAVIKALEYSKENKLDVLNMSLGGAGDPKTSPICDGIDSVTKEGIIVVSASGNSNIDTNTFVPGGCGSAITVAAVDENFKRATFSNYGTKVDVSAPGVNVYSTAPNNSYRKLSGTSMATPHIVGLVSVMKSFKPELTTLEIKEIFKTKNIAVNFESGKYIAGFPDIVNILKFLQNKEEPKLVEEEKVVEDELVDEVKNEEETEDGNKIILKSQIDSNLKYEVQKIETQNEDTEILPTIENNWIEAQNIDFGDKKEFDLQISSDEGKSKIEEISINEVSEKKKMPIEFSKDKTYDANGNRLDIKINSSEDDSEEDKIIEDNKESLENEKSLENEANQESVENEEEIIEMKDIYVDGSENLIEINSSGESKWEELEIKEKIGEEENIINKTDGEELNMFDIGKFSSIDLGGEEEIKYEEDNETKIEEGSIGIQNASYPVKIEEINYIFGDLTNTQKYESYITYRGTN